MCLSSLWLLESNEVLVCMYVYMHVHREGVYTVSVDILCTQYIMLSAHTQTHNSVLTVPCVSIVLLLLSSKLNNTFH